MSDKEFEDGYKKIEEGLKDFLPDDDQVSVSMKEILKFAKESCGIIWDDRTEKYRVDIKNIIERKNNTMDEYCEAHRKAINRVGDDLKKAIKCINIYADDSNWHEGKHNEARGELSSNLYVNTGIGNELAAKTLEELSFER